MALAFELACASSSTGDNTSKSLLILDLSLLLVIGLKEMYPGSGNNHTQRCYAAFFDTVSTMGIPRISITCAGVWNEESRKSTV